MGPGERNPLPPTSGRSERDLGDFPRDMILFSNADWDHCVRTNSQHMAERFAARGFRVMYVESLGLRRPSVGARDLKRMGRRLIRGLRGLRRVSENLWVCSPLVAPFHGNPAARAINRLLIDGSMRLMKGLLRFKRPILWAYNPMALPLWERLDPSLLVYHCVDDLAAVPGIPKEPVRAAEESMVGKADAVFVTSRELLRRLAPLCPDRIYSLPNVADFDHFSSAGRPGPIPRDLEAIPGPRVGFIGTVSSYKLDVDLILDVAGRRPDWHWVFVGPLGTNDSDALLERLDRPNVHVLGHRDYSDLPDYLRGMDVVTIPCELNEYTRSMFPMKFFEYLSAGKPVVSTPLDALTEYSQSFIAASAADEFLKAIQRALDGQGPDTETGVSLARAHTWDARLDTMLQILEKAWKAKTAADPRRSVWTHA